ncbi:unnamed protein product [Peniophora sp. CBMAI 1063]|nr:unnamed protein product [Peniophora sp. CBMAI 1063]
MAEEAFQTLLTSSIASRFSTHALSGGARGARMRSMDNDLDALEQAISQARRTRNMQSYTCALPRELLVHVFEHLREIWPPRRESKKEAVFNSGWITVTHVCAFWREVAFAVPSLWSGKPIDVFAIPYQYIATVLTLARSATLDIEVRCEGSSAWARADPSMNAWLTPPILRNARRLSICADNALLGHLWRSLPEHMNFLQELEVTSFKEEEFAELPRLLCNLPSVARLTLLDCQVPWRSALMSPQLTELHITNNPAGPPVPYDDLRDLLSVLQSLESLELRGVNPQFSTPLDQIPNIDLSPLLKQMITYTDYSSEIATSNLILNTLLQTPPQCNRTISIDGDLLDFDGLLVSYEDEGNVAPFAGVMSRLLHLLSLVDYEEMELRHLDLEECAIRLVSTSKPVHDGTMPRQRSYDCITRLHVMVTSDADCVNPHLYLHYVPVDRLHTLSLDESAADTLSAHNRWPGLLRAKELRTVVLTSSWTCHDYSNLFDALREEHFGGDSIDSSHILFPRMERLALPLFDTETCSSSTIADLIDLVHARQLADAPLRELLVPEGCRHWASWAALQTMVKVTFINYFPIRLPVLPTYTDS